MKLKIPKKRRSQKQVPSLSLKLAQLLVSKPCCAAWCATALAFLLVLAVVVVVVAEAAQLCWPVGVRAIWWRRWRTQTRQMDLIRPRTGRELSLDSSRHWHPHSGLWRYLVDSKSALV